MQKLLFLFTVSVFFSVASACFLSRWQRSLMRTEKTIFPLQAFFRSLALLIGLSCVFLFAAKEQSLRESILRLFLIAVLRTAADTDRTKQLIPNRLILPALIFRLLLYLSALLSQEITAGEVLLHIASSLLIPLVSLAVSALVPEGLGMGDVKLMFTIAFYLPFWESISAFFFSFLFAAAVSINRAVVGKQSLRSKIPLAPYFLAGTVSAFIMPLLDGPGLK